MISHGMSYVILIFYVICLAQDCVCLIAPFPFNVQPVEEFDPSADFDVTGEGNVWYARPQLFFSCSSPVLYADVASKRIVLPTLNCPWYSSVPLNQSTWHQTM